MTPVAAPPKTPVIIDTREPVDLTMIVSGHLSTDNVPTRREMLDSADYLLMDREGGTLGIERKTPLDFVGSIADGRLESQLERMLGDYDHRLLVIHGRYDISADQHLRSGPSWSMRDTRCWYAAFQAKLLAVQGRYDVRLLVVGSDEELCVLLRTLYRQGEDGRFRV